MCSICIEGRVLKVRFGIFFSILLRVGEVRKTFFDGYNQEARVSFYGIFRRSFRSASTMTIFNYLSVEKHTETRKLINICNNAVFICALDDETMPMRFLEANNITCAMLGYQRKELLGMSIFDIEAYENPVDITLVMESLIAEKRALFEMVHVAKNGRKFPVEVDAYLLELNAEPVALCFMCDISGRKRKEEERRRLLFEFRKSIGKFNKLRGLIPVYSSYQRVRQNDVSVRKSTINADGEREWGQKRPSHCGRGHGDENKIHPLSRREKEVLYWIRHGKSTGDVSLILGIKESTVKYHVSRIMQKLDAVSRTHAVAVAIDLGFI